MEAKNVIGSSSRSPECKRCGFWIYHYLTQTKQFGRTLLCSHISCTVPASHGGHVFIKNSGRLQYIIPLCASHNNPNFTDWYRIKQIQLAKANQNECTYRGKKRGLQRLFKQMKIT